MIARGGIAGTGTLRPLTRCARRASGGSNQGDAMTAAQKTHSATTNAVGDDTRLRDPATAATRKPARMLTTFTTSDDPTAATLETPARCDRTPIAPICHTLPGTYRPRFEMNQIRAALPHERCPPHAVTICRQVSISTT